MLIRRSLASFAFGIALTAGCGDDEGPPAGDAGTDAGDTTRDAGVDAGSPFDAGTLDAQVVLDSGGPAVDGGESNDADTVMDSGGDDAASDAMSVDAGSDAGVMNACESAGGICVADADACTDGGGSLLAGGNSGCVFSDGPGACCEPPAPEPTGNSCEGRGGVCAPIAGCNFVNGSFAAGGPHCSVVFELCCVQGTVCGTEDVQCCDPSGPTGYRAACDRGTFTCAHIPGTMLVAIDNCPP